MFNNKDKKNTMSQNTTSKFDTLLGQHTSINGDLTFSGILHIDGSVNGSLIGQDSEDVLTISETGKIEGKIEVANIVINGTIIGDVYSSGKIEVASKANIQGNIYYKSIEMDAGSRINGQLVFQEAESSNIKSINKENNS